mmetsp:Transcript_61850/g.144866  ORF Transcript_61850/g.144866 Transcript_61850/m.144866 type:complete len:252 (+) Transcript_61850:569-1324(+)
MSVWPCSAAKCKADCATRVSSPVSLNSQLPTAAKRALSAVSPGRGSCWDLHRSQRLTLPRSACFTSAWRHANTRVQDDAASRSSLDDAGLSARKLISGSTCSRLHTFSGKGCGAAGGSAGKLSRGTCSSSNILLIKALPSAMLCSSHELVTAISFADRPKQFLVWTQARAWSKQCTARARPKSVAKCSGVFPCSSKTSTGASSRKKTEMISARPRSAARCNADLAFRPSCSHVVISLTTAAWPCVLRILSR